MTERPDDQADRRDRRKRTERKSSGDMEQQMTLNTEVIEYDDQPAVCTVYPDPEEKTVSTTEWITVRRDVVVDLDANR